MKFGRRNLLIFIDWFTVLLTFFFTAVHIAPNGVSRPLLWDILSAFPAISISYLAMFWFFGVYKSIWRYAELSDYGRLALGGITAGCLFPVINIALNPRILPANVYIFSAICCFTFLILMRCIYVYAMQLLGSRPWEALPEDTDRRVFEKKRPALIIGAGSAGRDVAYELKKPRSQYRPVCFIDDNREKVGRTLEGVPILGTTDEMEKIALEQGIQVIIFAIPSCSEQQQLQILSKCVNSGCEIKVIPPLHDQIEHVELMKQSQSVEIEDLLGRKPVEFHNENVRRLVEGKVCLVTGGGGSIGSELCRQIAKNRPKKLIILDIYENNAYDIQQELKYNYKDELDLSVEIASVRDYQKLSHVFEKYRPQIVVHAAAHKHVPLMEDNPEEAVKNNVMGTFHVASLSDYYKVQRFIMISTDKAVNPTNVMGASKRICEMVVQYMSTQSTTTDYATVRFGNVLGSNGSVIPLFKKQIAAGGPVTVTHPDIIRYFMTIPEAVSLVLQAGSQAKGGEIFVLDMGKPVKIVTLAENLIRLSGYIPYVQMPIVFTGLRPGEKLYEELLMNEEGLKSTALDKIFIGRQIPIDNERFVQQLYQLREAAEANNPSRVVALMRELVPTFVTPEEKNGSAGVLPSSAMD